MKQEFRVGTKEIRSSAVGTGEKKKNTRKNRRITRKSVRTPFFIMLDKNIENIYATSFI